MNRHNHLGWRKGTTRLLAAAATLVIVSAGAQAADTARHAQPARAVHPLMIEVPGIPNLAFPPSNYEITVADLQSRIYAFSADSMQGRLMGTPGNVKGAEVKAETVAGGKVKYRLVRLTFGPEEKLELNVGIFTPAEGGPFPAIILQGGTPPGATGSTNTIRVHRLGSR